MSPWLLRSSSLNGIYLCTGKTLSIRRAVYLYLSILTVCVIVYSIWWRTSEIVFIGNLLQAAAICFSGIQFNQLALTALAKNRAWKGWACFAGGLWMWFLAQLMETYAEMILFQGSYGTISDCFWLIGSSLFLISGIILLRHYGEGSIAAKFRSKLGASSLVAAAYVAILALAVWPHLTAPHRAGSLKILDFTYPTIDFCIAFCFFLLMYAAKDFHDKDLAAGSLLIFIAFVTIAASDVLWGYFRDVETLIYRLQDILFFTEYSMFAFAAMLFATSLEADTE